MNSYRLVIAATIVLALGIALTVPLLKEADAAAFVSYLVLAEVVADIIATAYIGSLVLRDRRHPRSWLLMMLFTTSVFVTAGVCAIGYLVARRFLGLPPLEGGIGLLVSGMAIVVLGSVPIVKAVLFALVRLNAPEEPELP
jgi:hypothetical protein